VFCVRTIKKENLQCLEDLCKDHKDSEAVRGIQMALYLLYIMYRDCDKMLTSYTKCICKSHIETSKELFVWEYSFFRLNIFPRDFLYALGGKLTQLNTLYHFNNLFITLEYLLITCPLY